MKVTELYDEETLEYIGDVEELSGKIADLTKTASKPGGISLFTDETKTTYKSTYQLLKDISEIYSELTDKQQAGLLEALAGKRQGQIVAATITNFGAVEEALKNMENSAGSAEAEMETIRDSAEYAMNALKETFTSLAQHTISRGELKNLINAGTKILEIVDNIVKTIGSVPALLGTIFGIIGTKSKTLFSYNKTTDKFNLFGLDLRKGWLSDIKKVNQLQSTINGLRQTVNGATISQDMMNKVAATSNTELMKLVANYQRGYISSGEFKAGLDKMTTGLKGSNTGVTALKSGIKSLGAAIASVAASMAVFTLISAAIDAIGNGIGTIQKHADKVSELVDKEKSLKSEIEVLNDDLSNTKKRIYELQSMDKLTVLEQDELNRLTAYNDELERQLRLRRGELAQTSSDKNKEAQELWKEMTEKKPSWYTFKNPFKKGNNLLTGLSDALWDILPPIQWIASGINGLESIENNERLYGQLDTLEKYKEVLEEITKLKNSDAYKNGDSEATENVKQLQSELDELYDKNETAYRDFWVLLSSNLDPNLNENKETLKQVNDLIKEWEQLSGRVDDTFEKLYNNGKYAAVRSYLEDLAKKGKLTAEVFEKLNDNDISGIEDFKKALEEIPNVKVKDAIEAIYKAIDEAGKEADDAADGILTLAKALDKLYEKLDKVVSKQEKLADSFKKLRIGELLSAKEVYELVKEMPSVGEYIEKTVGGYTINTEGFKKINEEIRKQAKDEAEEDLKKVQEQIKLLENRDELEQKKNELDKKMRESNSYDMKLFRQWDSANASYYNAVKACQGITDSLDDLKNTEQSLIVSQDLLNESFDGFFSSEIYEDAKSKVYEYNKSIETLDNAIKTLNEQNLLSYDEMVAIIEIAPDLKDVYDEQGKGYSFVTSQIEEQRKKSLEARNEYINGLIEQAKTEIAAAESVKNACEIILNASNRLGTDEDRAKAQLELEIAQKRIEELEDTIKKFEALQGNLTTDDKKDDNSLSDEMQRRIDYYNTILSAVEAVKNKYTEAIDTEIEALEEGKDALKEANDERQRELDLIEARNNLENAKKRKVWVYSEADGFKQVQDEKALKEAEEKYRDTIQEVQEAAIDKQIDALEKKKETIEKQVEDLTGLESDIEDNKKIAQAITALGLSDEKDLLNLSDSVKQGIKEGLTEAILTKEKEDNKDNNQYIPVTVDDILKHLGAKVTTDDISGLDNVTQSIFDNAAKSFAESLKEYADSNVSNVVNNNSGMVISPTFNISGVTDPQEVAKVVNSEMTNLFTRLNNSIK